MFYPLLWKALYEVLGLKFPVGVVIFRFAVDITLDIYSKSIEEVD